MTYLVPRTRVFRWVVLALLLGGALLGTGGVAWAQSPSAVWIVPIDATITTATARYVEDRLARANAEGPLAVVFTIDTPGGSVEAAERISSAILRARVPTIAVVEQAISAGALVAMSAEQVAMLPGSAIGAATAINALTGEAAPEKISSVWRGRFRSVAEARGRNARVAEGMVSESIEIPGLSTAQELITLSAAQAVEYDIADLQASSLTDALRQLGYGDVATETLAPSPAERFASALANPLLAAVLLAVGLIGLAVEIFTPGFGIPGAVGLVALLLFFGGSFLGSPPGTLDLVLLVVGLLLIAVEVFVLPGFGVFGLLGFAAVAWGVARIFQGDALTMLGYTTIIGGALLALALWLLPNSRFSRPLTLSTRLSGGLGAQTPGLPLEATPALAELRGQRGVTLTDLRPTGVARFGERRVDVLSEGGFVPRGSAVEVLRVEGNRVTVREVTGSAGTPSGVDLEVTGSAGTPSGADLEVTGSAGTPSGVDLEATDPAPRAEA
ncbi:NfeD family protein [Truepera radiovictrix]|nr:NfeD family protein [Truepera radiovictrix]WMT57852.1 NfeD family protein [Truepera radiovictrix]